jgi:hypothetical protein
MHLTRILAIGGLLILCSSADTFAECQAPHYRRGPVFGDSSPRIYTASISLADFVPARMVCLAERLKRDHPREQHYAVLIFSSHLAAVCYHGPVDIGDRDGPVSPCDSARWSSHQLHGVYSNRFDDDAEFVAINPLGGLVGGRPPDPGETRIALPTMMIPDCQFAITNRCVISMDYPNVGGTYAHPASGTVTLTARLSRRGLIQDITVAETRDMQPASQEGVVAGAIANLKTWRVEPATHETTVRVKYQHVVDSSLSHPGQVAIQFDIPHQITIRARSMP